MTKLTWEELIEYVSVGGWTIEEIESRIASERFLRELANALYSPPDDNWYFPETKLFMSKEMFAILVDEGQELRKQFDKDIKGISC